MKVLLVDDHALFREGVALLLRGLDDKVETVEAGTCADALSALSANPTVDLVLLDIGLPDRSGIEVIGVLRERWPQLPIVAMSSLQDKDTVLEALHRGAMGFIPKSSTSGQMVGALRLVLSRGIYLPPSVFLDPIDRSRPRDVEQRSVHKSPVDLGLTERQAQVLYQILQGKPTKIISRELGLSANTVKAHTSAVLRALNVTTRVQAVVAASQLGLVFDPNNMDESPADAT